MFQKPAVALPGILAPSHAKDTQRTSQNGSKLCYVLKVTSITTVSKGVQKGALSEYGRLKIQLTFNKQTIPA